MGLSTMAQTTMNIYQSNGTILQISLADIDSVDFSTIPPPTMNIYQNNGTLYQVVLNDIDSITYSSNNLGNIPTLITLPIGNITSNSAATGGSISYDGGSPITERGVCWGLQPEPTIDDNYIANGMGTGNYSVSLSGLQTNTTYFVRAYAININGVAYGNELSFITIDNPGNGVTDIDGNSYQTVIIGNQEWMAENLRVTRYANGHPIPNIIDSTQWFDLTSGAWCFYENNNQFNVPYGKLYNWYAVSDNRNLCPTGWHVPTIAEWDTLINFLGGENVAGGKMKSKGTIQNGTGLWVSPNTNASNSSGFSGHPGGGRGNQITMNNEYVSMDSIAGWWASDSLWVDENIFLGIESGFELTYFESEHLSVGITVRCLKD